MENKNTQNDENSNDKKEKKTEDTKESKVATLDSLVSYIAEDKTYVFECPHCNLLVQVKENNIRCKIFRHAVYKATYEPIPAHAPKDFCETLL